MTIRDISNIPNWVPVTGTYMYQLYNDTFLILNTELETFSIIGECQDLTYSLCEDCNRYLTTNNEYSFHIIGLNISIYKSITNEKVHLCTDYRAFFGETYFQYQLPELRNKFTLTQGKHVSRMFIKHSKHGIKYSSQRKKFLLKSLIKYQSTSSVFSHVTPVMNIV